MRRGQHVRGVRVVRRCLPDPAHGRVPQRVRHEPSAGHREHRYVQQADDARRRRGDPQRLRVAVIRGFRVD